MFSVTSMGKNVSKVQEYRLSLESYQAPGGGGGEGTRIDDGGSTELHIANPKHAWAWNFTPKKITGIKISYLKKYKTKYLNTDLFNQTNFQT